MSERTLLLVKPDGVARGFVGEVVARIERKGSHSLHLNYEPMSVLTWLRLITGNMRISPFSATCCFHHRRPTFGRGH